MNFGPADSIDPVKIDPSVRFTSVRLNPMPKEATVKPCRHRGQDAVGASLQPPQRGGTPPAERGMETIDMSIREHAGRAAEARQSQQHPEGIIIGGLKEHIKCLREMIIFPLLYPELFKKFNTRPAKGVLFHGPPGTGKTLLARALANECSSIGGRKVSFFMRKGADVMNKYYGESERNVRVLFNTARRMKPSIIFFDEIDALAPARKPTQDTTQSSVVATLLAEMDGLCDRGNVVVIGATNRPNAMDPAVRRAGRFDRELYFPPPEVDARKEILHIYTKTWELSDAVLAHIAQNTAGYLGSDIKLLCSEAVLRAVRRVYPQIYESDVKLLINTQNVEVTQDDLLTAMENIIPTGVRFSSPAAKLLPPHTVPLLRDQVKAAAVLLNKAFPPPTDNKCKCKAESSSAPGVFMVSGECAEMLIAPALLAQLEHCFIKELSVPSLHSGNVHSPENAVISLFSECRCSGRSVVIFIRDLLAVWKALDRKNGGEVLLQMWRQSSLCENILLMAAWNGDYGLLPKKLQEIFPIYKDCIYQVRKPTAQEVQEFLTPIITVLPLVPPAVYTFEPPSPLPRAPTGPKENEEDMVRRIFQEYDNLRVLRSGLKSICRTLATDRRYDKFNSANYFEDSPIYYDIIKQPMDFTKMFNKFDNKKYFCAKEFLDDIDLIASNAILYQKVKPEKKLRNDAVQLHTDAYNLVAEEIDPHLEMECQLIARKRNDGDDDVGEGCSLSEFYMSKLANQDFNAADVINISKPKRRRKKSIDEPNPKRAKQKEGESSKREGDKFKNKNRSTPFQFTHMDNDKIIIMANEDLPELNPEDPEPKKDIKQNLTDTSVVLIDKSKLEEILKKYTEPLTAIGLDALIDLHTQLSKTVYGYSLAMDRTKLPSELDEIVNRYLAHAKSAGKSSENVDALRT